MQTVTGLLYTLLLNRSNLITLRLRNATPPPCHLPCASGSVFSALQKQHRPLIYPRKKRRIWNYEVCAQAFQGSCTCGRGGENGTHRAPGHRGRVAGEVACLKQQRTRVRTTATPTRSAAWVGERRGEGRGARGGRRTGSAPPSPAAEETAASSSPSSRAPELAAGNSVWLAPLLRLRRQQRAKSAWRTEGVGWVGECERWAAHVGRAGAAVHHRRRRSGADHRVHVATFM